VVKLPSGAAEHRLYLALREGKRYALILSTASSEDLLKAAVEQAEGVADGWDYSAEFPTARMLTVGASVVQVRLPAQDVTLFYVGAAGGFTVKLEAKDGSVEGKKYYIGDGAVALDLVATRPTGSSCRASGTARGTSSRTGRRSRSGPGTRSCPT
jgi:hypothetical protein